MNPLSQHEVQANLRPLGNVDKASGACLPPSASDESAGTPVGSTSFRGEELRARAADAFHSYLVYRSDYDLTHVSAATNRVMYLLDRIADNLALRGQGEDNS